MDKRMKVIYDNFDKLVIGKEESFRFHCTACGKCCINREDILLNPYDLYRIAKALNKKPYDVLLEYCDSYIGESSKMVIVRIKLQGTIKVCPFLKGVKCSIHTSKPTVCALFPLGRSLQSEGSDHPSVMQAEVKYIFQNPPCGDASEIHTVREWLGYCDYIGDEEYFKTWMQLTIDCVTMARNLEKVCSEKCLNAFYVAILRVVYLHYAIDEPFMPQFLKNLEVFRQSVLEPMLQLGIPDSQNTDDPTANVA